LPKFGINKLLFQRAVFKDGDIPGRGREAVDRGRLL